MHLYLLLTATSLLFVLHELLARVADCVSQAAQQHLPAEGDVRDRVPDGGTHLDQEQEDNQGDVLLGDGHDEHHDEHHQVEDARVATSLGEHLLALALGADQEGRGSQGDDVAEYVHDGESTNAVLVTLKQRHDALWKERKEREMKGKEREKGRGNQEGYEVADSETNTEAQYPMLKAQKEGRKCQGSGVIGRMKNEECFG